jgi:hypothetical protein
MVDNKEEYFSLAPKQHKNWHFYDDFEANKTYCPQIEQKSPISGAIWGK